MLWNIRELTSKVLSELDSDKSTFKQIKTLVASCGFNTSKLYHLQQNVNYAIKLTYALPLLYDANVKFNKNNYKKIFSKPELVKKVKRSIILILAK